MTLDELRRQYIRAKEQSNKPEYWKALLVDRLQRMISYAEGAEKAKLKKELFSIH